MFGRRSLLEPSSLRVNATEPFIANTSNQQVQATATVGAPRTHAAWLDPDSGKLTRATPAGEHEHALVLAPYESRVLVMSDRPL